jgi:general L-amino acid transport system substrate-binding protein
MKLMLIMAALVFAATGARAGTLDEVKAKDVVRCGVEAGFAGFSEKDAKGNWGGLEVDYCRALAAAIFDDPAKVSFLPVSADGRFAALKDGKVDVLARTTAWTAANDTTEDATFVGTIFYDGQGFMVRADSGVTSALQLSGARLCVVSGTNAEASLGDYFAANNMKYTVVEAKTDAAATKDFAAKKCSAFTALRSTLAVERQTLPDAASNQILPETVSKEPIGIAVRQGDDPWFGVARWTLYALLDAEEMGITQANVDEMLGSDNPAIKRFLGVEGDFGAPLGLTKDWAYRIIKNVGNYGEIYDRYLGPNTPIGMPRGLNALWTQGGIQYAPPIR